MKGNLRRGHFLSDHLRESIAAEGISAHALARAAKVAPAVITRFLAGKRSMTLDTADRLAYVLGLRLVTTRARVRARSKPRRAAAAAPETKSGD